MKEEEESKKKGPKLNIKNKAFASWTKAESLKREDNIMATDWHEKLKEVEPFAPVYKDKPLNMVYLLSMEYGRIWLKERDEWYKNAFIPKPKERDMLNRRKKIQLAAKLAKKEAEKNAKERKVRRTRELEAKAKIKAEEVEKLKERVRKLKTPRSSKAPDKTKKKEKEENELKERKGHKGATEKKQEKVSKETKEKPEGKEKPEESFETSLYPKKEEAKPSELKKEEVKEMKPMKKNQCECSDHENKKSPLEKVQETEEQKEYEIGSQEKDRGCIMCEAYQQQMWDSNKNMDDDKEELCGAE